MPYLNAEHFRLFIDVFAQAFADSLNIRLLDNSGTHTAQRLTISANVRLVSFTTLWSGATLKRASMSRLQDDIG